MEKYTNNNLNISPCLINFIAGIKSLFYPSKENERVDWVRFKPPLIPGKSVVKK